VAVLDPATHVFLAYCEQIMYDAVHGGWVYFLTNRPHGTLYVGCAVDIARRAWEHREGVAAGFTKKYGLKRLVYAEWHDDILRAKQREMNIKH
jgi:putative endonuclease